MASLNKLAIRGIRSFDDKQISIIEFFSPVTVIVGHNGSGKTTIIECLKYATTGDQPPNTRGGAFVHDPKMANEKEVKAQVKLRFHAANGARMLAVRNLSVTVKKTGLTMKTLESILALADGNADKNGKRGVISTKCAEIDAEIPQLLGVSKAVLENVIFCHQEDSYWPLAEPAALKKKFDDIFEATRYTKALVSIKNLRKDRTAELKAEKERLLSLSREKAHSDKLKERIANHNAQIAAKEVEYEESKQEYDSVAESNRKFYEYNTKFREIFVAVEKLEGQKTTMKSTLAELTSKLQEIPGTDEELDMRQKHFDDRVNAQKQKRVAEERKKDDLEEELNSLQNGQRDLLARHGRLLGEEEENKRRISEREQSIREMGELFGIKGYNYSPLDERKVVEFVSRLGDVQRKQKMDFEKLQGDLKAQNDEYHRKLRSLENELESHKSQRKRLRDQIEERQSKARNIEDNLEDLQILPASLRALQSDIEEKKGHLQKLKQDLTASNYDGRLAEKAEKSRRMEAKREQLSFELQTLSLQADSRAKLEINRKEVKNKTSEIERLLEVANIKFKALIGQDVNFRTFQTEVDQVYLDKEQEQADIDAEATIANTNLQKAESNLSHLKTQLNQKKTELKNLERTMRAGLDHHPSLDAALKEATIELNHRTSLAGNMLGTSTIYESLLSVGRQRKICGACNRHLTDQEFVVFEEHMKDSMKKSSPAAIEENKSELAEWQTEMDRLQALRPVQASLNRLKAKEIPLLEDQIKEQEDTIPEISQKAEKIGGRLETVKRQLSDISSLKVQAITVARLQSEIDRAKHDIGDLESSLSSSGSTKTADDVQNELSELSGEIRKNDREKQAINMEVENQTRASRDLENSLHQMELKERDLVNKIRDKDRLEEDIERMRQEMSNFSGQSKDLDTKISEAQSPIEALQRAYQQSQNELNTKISHAQRLCEEVNKNSDRLNDMNKNVERYRRQKKEEELKRCALDLSECEMQLREINNQLEGSREIISSIEKEIHESGASYSNLRDNIIARNLAKDIAKTQAEINSYDMEEAGKARRNYDEKYEPAKKREKHLHEAYNQLSGELSSLKVQQKTLETDLKEFRDVHKKYTDQLIRVKVSDMANSDLEKYAKALDNAIMKYHGLKMEEVNDTMKHLWNKTYQGTDIDGIKIRSDIEGGASNRSYNYRVVMTKDQVEMDMRGRCSAGQKMLASIIIRLALSDSFGHNCGILALDEPTNALDTENIDALAASLVDIINERKSHSNFQLIIITHDENFLRKLGQSDVMEYYWRVSRDSRQKSVIERQRFR